MKIYIIYGYTIEIVSTLYGHYFYKPIQTQKISIAWKTKWTPLNLIYFDKILLYVCLEFIVPLENFHSYGDVTIAGERLQILSYARHSWPLSSEGYLTCHTYCDTGLHFIMVISEDT